MGKKRKSNVAQSRVKADRAGVQRAADLLGHGLRIESAPGQGTRVLIDLSREVLRVD